MINPEDAFTGALLHQSATTALDALRLVQAEDLADPHLSLIVAAAGQLAEQGVAPDPVTVLSHLRATGTVGGTEAVQVISARLLEVYGSVPVPESIRHYAAGVLDDEVRRRFRELADRVGQASDTASLETLVHVLDAECRAVRNVLDRRQVYGTHTPEPIDADSTPARLRAVGA